MNSPRRSFACLLQALAGFGLLLGVTYSQVSGQELPQAGAPAPVPGKSSAPATPDILFIVIDDASYEEFEELDLPVYRSLLAKGRLYSNFYVSPLCSPSRYQMQFGQYPHRALLGEALRPRTDPGVPLSAISLAEYLGAHGYATGLFGKWHLSGIGEPQAPAEVARLQGYQTWRAGNTSNLQDHYKWPRIDDGTVTVCEQYSTLAVNEAIESWWRDTAAPRFASLCYFAPHEPFQFAPEELDPSQTESYNPRRRYESALRGVDAAIGRMLEQIDLSQTFVFLLSDNGTPANVRPSQDRSVGYKGTVYQGGIHVPLLVLGPGIAPGNDPSLVQATDLARTAIQLAHLPLPQAGFEDSIDFSASLDGTQPGPRPWAFLQRFEPNGPAQKLELNEWTVIRADGYKLLRDQMGQRGVLELYYLPDDPFERKRRSDAAVTSALTGIMEALLVAPWPY